MATKADYRIIKALCKEEGLPLPEREFTFMEERRFRFDFAWPDQLHTQETVDLLRAALAGDEPPTHLQTPT